MTLALSSAFQGVSSTAGASSGGTPWRTNCSSEAWPSPRLTIAFAICSLRRAGSTRPRSEEHTSELQSQSNLVCRLLLEKKNINERELLGFAIRLLDVLTRLDAIYVPYVF